MEIKNMPPTIFGSPLRQAAESLQASREAQCDLEAKRQSVADKNSEI